MSDASATTTILLVDPDARARTFLASQLKSLGYRILEAGDGPSAFRIATTEPVRLIVTELYVATGDDADLINAIRSNKALRKTRTLAHTHRSMPADREWALQVGADAYLIKPTRAERMRYVVARLTTGAAPNAARARVGDGDAIVRRDSLDAALSEVEGGRLPGTSSIVFGRTWWQRQTPSQQTAYRRRAKAARVSLRSDSLLKTHFVEVRGPARSEQGLSTERPESPYRR